MSQIPSSGEGADKDKVLAAFGGKKGLIDSGIPSVVFLVAFNVANDLRQALIASLIVSATLTIIRLAKRDTIQHAISGLIGSLICAWLLIELEMQVIYIFRNYLQIWVTEVFT